MLTYTPSLAGGFVYEDLRWGTTPSVLSPTDTAIGPRWLTTQTYAWTTVFWDAGPRAARTVSLSWHLLNGVLLWLAARAVVTGAAATFAAGLFLLHPLQTEAVASIGYRAELVAASLLLLALVCASRGWLVLAWLAAAGAVLGKETGVLALALVPLWLTMTRSSAWTPTARVYWLAAIYVPLLLLLDRLSRLVPHLPAEVSASIAAGWALLARVAVPAQLSIEHDWAQMSPVAAFATVVLTAGVVETAWRRRSWLGLGVVAWIAVAWLPRLFWHLGEGFHERYLYVPLIAVCLALGAALFPKGRAA